jgi:hypothetical protein
MMAVWGEYVVVDTENSSCLDYLKGKKALGEKDGIFTKELAWWEKGGGLI